MPESRLARTRAAYEGGTLTPEPGETARERVDGYKRRYESQDCLSCWQTDCDCNCDTCRRSRAERP